MLVIGMRCGGVVCCWRDVGDVGDVGGGVVVRM